MSSSDSENYYYSCSEEEEKEEEEEEEESYLKLSTAERIQRVMEESNKEVCSESNVSEEPTGKSKNENIPIPTALEALFMQITNQSLQTASHYIEMSGATTYEIQVENQDETKDDDLEEDDALNGETKCDITTEDKINIKSLIGRQITFKQDTEFIEGKIHNIETDTGIFVIEFINLKDERKYYQKFYIFSRDVTLKGDMNLSEGLPFQAFQCDNGSGLCNTTCMIHRMVNDGDKGGEDKKEDLSLQQIPFIPPSIQLFYNMGSVPVNLNVNDDVLEKGEETKAPKKLPRTLLENFNFWFDRPNDYIKYPKMMREFIQKHRHLFPLNWKLLRQKLEHGKLYAKEIQFHAMMENRTQYDSNFYFIRDATKTKRLIQISWNMVADANFNDNYGENCKTKIIWMKRVKEIKEEKEIDRIKSKNVNNIYYAGQLPKAFEKISFDDSFTDIFTSIDRVEYLIKRFNVRRSVELFLKIPFPQSFNTTTIILQYFPILCDQYEAIDILDNNDTDIEGITLHKLGIKSWSKRWKRYENKDGKWRFKFFRSLKKFNFLSSSNFKSNFIINELQLHQCQFTRSEIEIIADAVLRCSITKLALNDSNIIQNTHERYECKDNRLQHLFAILSNSKCKLTTLDLRGLTFTVYFNQYIPHKSTNTLSISDAHLCYRALTCRPHRSGTLKVLKCNWFENKIWGSHASITSNINFSKIKKETLVEFTKLLAVNLFRRISQRGTAASVISQKDGDKRIAMNHCIKIVGTSSQTIDSVDCKLLLGETRGTKMWNSLQKFCEVNVYCVAKEWMQHWEQQGLSNPLTHRQLLWLEEQVILLETRRANEIYKKLRLPDPYCYIQRWKSCIPNEIVNETNNDNILNYINTSKISYIHGLLVLRKKYKFIYNNMYIRSTFQKFLFWSNDFDLLHCGSLSDNSAESVMDIKYNQVLKEMNNGTLFNKPEMLIGLSVTVTWSQNKKYQGIIANFLNNGENDGKYEVVYNDGDIKFYHFIVLDGEMIAANNGNEEDIHTFSINNIEKQQIAHEFDLRTMQKNLNNEDWEYTNPPSIKAKNFF